MDGLQKTKYDWRFNAKSKYACKSNGAKGCYFPRGKMIGGSASMNFMFYVRGNKEDYNAWAALGNTGWDYESVLPYFKKSEGNQNAQLVQAQHGRYHSATGPMKVHTYSADGTEPLHQILTEAAVERGNKVIDDINQDQELGYVVLQGTSHYGQCQSTAKAFLIPAMKRKNLHLIKHAFVEKILIKNNVAYGVEFTYKGEHKMKAFARKEVIVSAGVISSPQLLMLSGIGPRSILQKHNIPVRTELPVGENLLDHPYALLWLTLNPTATLPLLPFTGPLNSVGVTKLAAFINTVNGTGSPDFELRYFHFTQNSPDLPAFMNKLSYTADIKQKMLYENTFHDLLGVASCMLHAKSHGYIKLSSASACDKPIIRPRYFSHPDDMEDMLRAVKLQLSYLDTISYKAVGAEMMNFPLQCDRYEFRSDNYYRCYIQYFSSTTFNPVGTSKMGPNTDRTAVVDPRLRVRNIRNLRQIDAGM